MRRALLLPLLAASVVAAGCAARSVQRPPGPPPDAGCSAGAGAGACPGASEPARVPAPVPAPAGEAVSGRRGSAVPAPVQTPPPAPAGASPPAPAGALPARAAQQIAALLAAKAARTPAQHKIGSQLLAEAEGVPGGPGPAASPQPAVVAPEAADLLDDLALVDVRTDVTPAVLERIRDLDGTVVNNVPRYRSIRARLPRAGLETLAALDAVQSIRTADEPRTRTQRRQSTRAGRSDPAVGAVSRKVDTGEGDRAHRADAARTTHGVDGAGIAVGVLSDGVNTLAAQQATGDVPALVTILPGQEGGAFRSSCGGASTGTEGTAMFEIVHDLAPGAELFFATAGGGQAQMAQNIEDLCEAGADVIVDDVGYLFDPAFQDGDIARAISTVTENGCHYFTAAGNGGSLHHGTSGVWEGDFAAGPTLRVDGTVLGTAHAFGDDVAWNRITRDSTSGVVLQWADPWGASTNDYDLFLLDANNNLLAASTSTQNGTQDPFEYIAGSCVSDRTGTRLVIVRNTGAADRYLRLTYARGGLAVATTGRTFGHSASRDAVGVAAVDARSAAGAGGVFNGTELVETFSSDGPRRIFFEADGTAITPSDFSSSGGRVLQKPDLAAADGVRTSTPGFSRFYGTSAAAPHAAAIAALMVEAAGGPANVTPAALRSAMTGNALDIMASGTDVTSGAGIVMAPGAVDAVDVVLANRNRPPAVATSLTDRTFELGAAAVTIDLEGVFDDPDDDTLTYTLQLSRNVPVATLAGSTLTLTPAGPIRAVRVTVRATDPDGLTRAVAFTVTVTAGDRDYDADNDNLIDVATLAQLDAVRYDLDGNGWVDGATWRPYYEAFDEGTYGMGCPDGCAGYELTADLDFDTNGSGDADSGDDYWNDGDGWDPIGDRTAPFEATLEGNRRTVSHLFIDGGDHSGLFGATGSASLVRRLGLVDADVTGEDHVAALVAEGAGEIRSSYVTGRVTGDYAVGGLIGFNNGGTIDASYATARVTGEDVVGGLAGLNGPGRIRASYATGRVSGDEAGGLVGRNTGTVAASYATGRVLGAADVGGLAGSGSGAFRASYWDRKTSGVRVGVGEDDLDDDGWLEAGESRTPGVAGLSTAALQGPTGYDGIYRTWNLDIDGDLVPDAPWFLASAGSYPILAVLDYAAGGYQLSRAPTLSAATSAGQAQVALSWTALVASNFWLDGPDITYSLIRDDGAAFEVLQEETGALRYTDASVTAGTTYTYQVAAVVQGGEATRSAALQVVAGAGNQPPVAMGALADRTLRVGGGAVRVDVAGAFADPENDALTYGASSSATGVATVATSGAQVTITPAGTGAATITVTATDAAGSNTSARQRFRATVWPATAVDYDADDDGLIEIATPAQLDAVRHDLDGNGMPASGGATSYRAAFADAGDGLGCGGVDGCTGYELAADLDLDTNGSGGADAGDDYWNGGLGWDPIGTGADPFTAILDGNGRTIANLFIDAGGGGGVVNGGLFGVTGPTSVIRGVGLAGVAVRAGGDYVGSLIGVNNGIVTTSHATGRVEGDDFVGGLVGLNGGAVAASHATGRVEGESGDRRPGRGDLGGRRRQLRDRARGGPERDRRTDRARVRRHGEHQLFHRACYRCGQRRRTGRNHFDDLRRRGDRQLLGHGHLRPLCRRAGAGPGPVDGGVAGSDGLHRHLPELAGRPGRGPPPRLSLGLRNGHAIPGPGAGRGRQRAGHVAGARPPVAGRTRPDGVGRSAQGGSDLDRGGCEPLDPGAGRPLHGVPGRRRRDEGPRRGRRRPGAHRYQRSHRGHLHVSGCGSARRRRSGLERTGDPQRRRWRRGRWRRGWRWRRRRWWWWWWWWWWRRRWRRGRWRRGWRWRRWWWWPQPAAGAGGGAVRQNPGGGLAAPDGGGGGGVPGSRRRPADLRRRVVGGARGDGGGDRQRGDADAGGAGRGVDRRDGDGRGRLEPPGGPDLPGDGRLRIRGRTRASGRPVDGGNGRGRRDHDGRLRLDGHERVLLPDGDVGSRRLRPRLGDLRGGAERGRSPHRRADGGGAAGDRVSGVPRRCSRTTRSSAA